MRPEKCGICNEEVPVHHCALYKREEDQSLTTYHMRHEGQLKDLKPCSDCGHHRLLCDECKELE
ncbi:hypothetical protein CPT_Mater188 [Bacillus phage Mater]|uniref:Uncharacterized protein n=1 Tax=Bacillus phage Mater TaxID=1540090 RepID=A0A0A0RMQ1_9CAUD|nr:hypothetical protein CPT_Mater188 [Bacillus phage Mater]AIW03345.1 hypothetical protein CPT_Mater188 [Bacillus phage Mater]